MNNKKGITLIELIIYMGIFSFIFITTISSLFYIQKIIQSSNESYYTKNQIYNNLNILQQYLFSFSVTVENGELNFFDQYNNLVFTQKVEGNVLKNIYPSGKVFESMPYINIDNLYFDMMNRDEVIRYVIIWKDNDNKHKQITEYLIVINKNM